MNHTEYLNDGETMALSLRPHKLYLAPSFVGLVIGLVAAVAWFVAGLEGDMNSSAKIAVAILFVSACTWFAWSVLEWHFTRFHLTSERVLIWSGVLARRRAEIPLNRVNTVFVRQSIFERLVRCGRLSIESAGEAGQQEFPQCPRPLDVKQAIYRQRTEGPMPSGPFGSSDSGLASQIERLAALRDQGILDEWEFDDAKTRVLTEYGSTS